MSPKILHLWLHSEPLGELEQLRNGAVRLRFSTEALDRWGVGTRVLSYSLPLTTRRVQSEALDDYLDNLLPEGAIRSQLEQQYRVRPGDTFGLLCHVGGECAGAVQLTVGDQPQDGHLVAMTEAEVTQIVEDLPTLAAPQGQTVGASLGGVQSKVLLTRTSDGWAWPAAGAMSTHIIKPEPIDPSVAVPEIIEYEHWAMQLAAAVGLNVARSELVRFGDRLALVVERYDRNEGRRVHQEDFAQALGLRPGNKYEPADERPSRLARIAAGPASESLDPGGFRLALLKLVAFNLVIGNGDAHAKNYSMLLSDGLFSLAPAYDIAPIFCVNDRFSNFGMQVADQRNLKYLSATHLLTEAVGWGLDEAVVRQVVGETALAVLHALDEVPDDSLPVRVGVPIRARATEFAHSSMHR